MKTVGKGKTNAKGKIESMKFHLYLVHCYGLERAFLASSLAFLALVNEGRALSDVRGVVIEPGRST